MGKQGPGANWSLQSERSTEQKPGRHQPSQCIMLGPGGIPCLSAMPENEIIEAYPAWEKGGTIGPMTKFCRQLQTPSALLCIRAIINIE